MSAEIIANRISAGDLDYRDYLKDIAQEDAEGLVEAHRHYGRSCLNRGGVGLFMMLARKWDRLEKALEESERPYDVFDVMRQDGRSEGIIDDIRDLRRYLMLLEAEARHMSIPCAQSKHRDNA